jgi:hypothetical protein
VRFEDNEREQHDHETTTPYMSTLPAVRTEMFFKIGNYKFAVHRDTETQEQMVHFWNGHYWQLLIGHATIRDQSEAEHILSFGFEDGRFNPDEFVAATR